MNNVHNIVQKAVIILKKGNQKNHPKEKEMQEGKVLSEEAL